LARLAQFEHDDVNAAPGEIDRQSHADRSATDNQDARFEPCHWRLPRFFFAAPCIKTWLRNGKTGTGAWRAMPTNWRSGPWPRTGRSGATPGYGTASARSGTKTGRWGQ